MVQTDTNAFAILTTTPHQHALSELSARARDGQELINASLTPPGATEAFLRGIGPLTSGIAFGLSRLTGMSATYWLGLWRKACSSTMTGLPPATQTEQLSAANTLISATSIPAKKMQAAFTAGTLLDHTLELSSALVCTALQTSDPCLFRASAEAIAGHEPEITHIVSHARLNDPDQEIACTALLILYGVESGAAVRHAYDCLTSPLSPSGQILDTAKTVIQLFYKTHQKRSGHHLPSFDEATTQLADLRQPPCTAWETLVIEDAMQALAAQIPLGHGDQHLLQGKHYHYPATSQACLAFFTSDETQTRIDALRAVASRTSPIGACLALCGVRDNDPDLKVKSLALLQMYNGEAGIREAERLRVDDNPRVREVSERILSPTPADTGAN